MRCIRLKPFSLDGRVIVDVQQLIPLPEAAEYQVRVREKQERERAASLSKWDLEKFLIDIERHCGAAYARSAKDLHDWAKDLCTYVWFGEGEFTGTFTPILKIDETKYHLFVVRTDGNIVIRFLNMREKGTFANRHTLDEFRRRLNQVPGVQFAEDDLDGKPRFDLKVLEPPPSLERFKEAILWAINMARHSEI